MTFLWDPIGFFCHKHFSLFVSITTLGCACTAQHTFSSPHCALMMGALCTCAGVMSSCPSQSKTTMENQEKMEVPVTHKSADTTALEGIAWQVSLPYCAVYTNTLWHKAPILFIFCLCRVYMRFKTIVFFNNSAHLFYVTFVEQFCARTAMFTFYYFNFLRTSRRHYTVGGWPSWANLRRCTSPL